MFSDMKNNVITWAKKLKSEVFALSLAIKHPKTPIAAKIMAMIVVGYALSPIDLIPDFIPILGYLDDALLLPLGIAISIKLIPNAIMEECRKEAKVLEFSKGSHRVAAGVVVIIWTILLILVLKQLI